MACHPFYQKQENNEEDFCSKLSKESICNPETPRLDIKQNIRQTF
jgi:hypothetical protein